MHVQSLGPIANPTSPPRYIQNIDNMWNTYTTGYLHIILMVDETGGHLPYFICQMIVVELVSICTYIPLSMTPGLCLFPLVSK